MPKYLVYARRIGTVMDVARFVVESKDPAEAKALATIAGNGQAAITTAEQVPPDTENKWFRIYEKFEEGKYLEPIEFGQVTNADEEI